MRPPQSTVSVTEHEHDHSNPGACACGAHHTHVRVRLNQTMAGFVLILNSFLVEWLVEHGRIAASASALLGALVLGVPLVRIAIKDLLAGALNTNALAALAVATLFAAGNYQEAGIVAFFMLMGQIVEARSAEGALASIHSLIRLTPTRARRLHGTQEEEVAVKELRVGDVVRVRPGDSVAADGIVLGGQAALNEANITGESLPVEKGVGDEVYAGTLNLTGVLDLRVTRAGRDTTLGRVRDLILSAEQTKLPITRLMDQHMGYYTPFALLLGGLVWLFTHDVARVVSVFIVACPCAFVLATPTAMVAALSAAARLGILIKNVSHLELAGRVNAFIFDKTGTLTTGTMAVSRLTPVEGVIPAELLRLAASAERHSNHPTAKALVGLAEEVGVGLAEPEGFRETAGLGVTAIVDGASVLVGRARWLAEHGVTDCPADSVDLDAAEGWSLVFVARAGRCIGWVGMRDQLRAEARQALQGLRDCGVRRLAMVSGDRTAVAQWVARELGCEEVRGDCLPEHKVQSVGEARAKGYCVAVVGDGVNDAPALAAGDLGVAMGAAGSDVAIHSASVALMNNDLCRLPFLVTLSRRTRAVINQNFILGVCFVFGGLVLSAMDYINPVVAAIFHVSGSLLVVANSFRLVRMGEEAAPAQAVMLPHRPPPVPLADHDVQNLCVP